MRQLLMAQLAVDVGCYWHRLQGGQSVLKAPQKLPLRGSSSTTSRQREQQLQSIYVEPQHQQLLDSLGVVLPQLESLTEPGFQPPEGAEQMLLPDPLFCLLYAHDRRAFSTFDAGGSSSRGGSGQAGVLSTSMLCKLLRVQLQALLLEDAHQFVSGDLSPLFALTYFLGQLLVRCRNVVGSCPINIGGTDAHPAANSMVSETALHILQLLLHHIVPALLNGCRLSPQQDAAEDRADRISHIKADLAHFTRSCVELAIGEPDGAQQLAVFVCLRKAVSWVCLQALSQPFC